MTAVQRLHDAAAKADEEAPPWALQAAEAMDGLSARIDNFAEEMGDILMPLNKGRLF